MAEEPVPQKEPLTLQILEKMSQLMTAAFGLVAALAWNDAIKAAIQQFIGPGTQLRAQLLYATVVTVVAVLAALWIAAAISRIKKRTRRERLREAGGPGKARPA